MDVEDLTLEQMFALESEHPPFVGSRTSVFLTREVRRAAVKTQPDETKADIEQAVVRRKAQTA
jgi:hypothetical protein